MSIANPPIIVTSIYNPAFFEASATDTITQAQANALFLKKTTADTATALETFSSGIATNSLATTSLASNLQIGSSTNTGTIFISTIATNNSNANPAISIGGDAGVKTIKINNGTNSVHCSSIDMAGSGINNVTNSTGNIDIGNLQTSGVCNIGTGARVLTGSGGGINIGTGSSSIVNPITIGGASSATSVGGTLGVTGVLTATGGIKGNSYDINILSPSELAFGASVTNDVVRIAEGMTTGQVLIGNGASCNGSVYIMTSGTSARSIGIGSTTATTTINLNGNVTLQKPLILGTIPTVNTQLGFSQDGTQNASIIVSVAGSIKEIASITIPNAGIYYLQANTAFPSVVSLYNSTSISTSNTVNNTQCQTQMGSSGSGNNYHNISSIFTATANQIFYLLATSGTVPQTMQVVFLRATRIA